MGSMYWGAIRHVTLADQQLFRTKWLLQNGLCKIFKVVVEEEMRERDESKYSFI